MFEIENYEQSGVSVSEIQEKLSADLSDAILNGDADRMIRLDRQIKELSARAFAAEVAEIKKILEQNEIRKAEIGGELSALREIKANKNRKLARAIGLAEKRGLAVTKAQFAIEIAENELENIRVSNRELKAKLDDLKQAKLDEVNRENGRFN